MAAFPAITRHLRSHVGAGILCAVGYFDPGNWSVDIQAGTTFGYRPMLFVVLLSGILAILFQVLATRLGCVTGLDLAANCRILLHDHPRHPRLLRFCVLYPLYVLSEIAIIATDLAELLGTAIGITLLIPALPLWACVLLTGLDVFVFLLITDRSHAARPVRPVEIVIIIMVAAVFVSLIILVIKIKPVWPEVFFGFVPSEELFSTQPDAIYAAIGIVGATIMPHVLFLGSYFATQDRVPSAPLPSPVAPQHSSLRSSFRQHCRSFFSFTSSTSHHDVPDTSHRSRRTNSLSFIQAHMTHAVADITLSLLVLAIPINAAILIISAAVPQASPSTSVGIPSMYDLILNTLGKGMAFLFAFALVFSGQAASITATLAGQVVSEGFLQWSISPFLRRLVTRFLSLIPSMIVAMAFGRSGLSTLLVASQVALSIILPFVMFPLIYLTSSKTVMSVDVPEETLEMNDSTDQTQTIGSSDAVCLQTPTATPSALSESLVKDIKSVTIDSKPLEALDAKGRVDTIDFSNCRFVSIVSYAIWLIILIANIYGISTMGSSG